MDASRRTTSTFALLRDGRRACRQGPDALAARRRDRLAAMTDFARVHSPYYRRLYRRVPTRVTDPALLPVTDKQTLMRHFDDWVTDREVTLDRVRSFVDDPHRIGDRFLGRYLVSTTSGTTGHRGIFLLDERAATVFRALSLRAASRVFTPGLLVRMLARRAPSAHVIATGGHLAANAVITRMHADGRRHATAGRVFSAHTPLPELVEQLNRCRPLVLVGYATVIALLAGEQLAGRLRIAPALVSLVAEGLTDGGRRRIRRAFTAARVMDTYGCNESLALAYGCPQGWLHVHSDWLILEPVDADHRPTPPGQQSSTVLLTSLCRLVQPILRYDLGDSVLCRPDPCPCGDPLPAIRVRGRAADLLSFPRPDGDPVRIVPMAFETLVETVPDIDLFQIVQTTPTTVRIRIRPAAGADPDRVWCAVRARITGLLTRHGAAHVTVERAQEPPVQSAGGKFRVVIPCR
ncbi:phenylacetate--CoA ligase family protein [Streptomyces sp. HNM0663]|uniref:Phenylacetate--CoA ligase family protein n=1 Tax=Streptomyces chengmaiensis TaxID=3040919 RepID=A0ABT6HKG0_9ACTN|nr:phenylacetate--CoA ligase family protein [Streptomyces chengmaiensis]MDH2389227.1 phenylacetate--CoA ligase family protein [Streptomyces chengmaiensis]